MKSGKNTIRFSLLLCVCIAVQSCGPVNFLTHTKPLPRRYTENYNYPNVKAIRSEANLRAWVVYSDRTGNITTEQPGGTLEHTELDFMEPLLVIGKRGNYYKLIRHKPAVLKNRRSLTNRGEVEYVGWLHRDRLLLFDNSITEIRNGIKLKNLTTIQNGRYVTGADKYFRSDSLILYSQPKLTDATGILMGMNNIAYVLKYVENDTRALVGYRPKISPELVDSLVTGWVDASLIAPFGQRLTVGTAPLIVNEEYRPDTLCVDSLRRAVSPVESFHPVLYADHRDSLLVFRTLDGGPVIDHRENRIFNVDGDPITWDESKVIESNLRNVNVIFAFELTDNVIAQMPALSNTVQNVNQVFETSPRDINYQYAAALGDSIVLFEHNYLNFSDRVIELAKDLKPSPPYPANRALTHAVRLAGRMPKATNLIVYVGEKSNTAEYPSREIIDGFIDNNCRLLSYHVFSDNNDIFNNFVLQSTAIIEHYADTTKVLKRKIIVYPDQVHRMNWFKENTKNAYALDFPRRSMTQGMVIFPEKGQMAEPELLAGSVDSIVRQIEADNLNLIASMDRAFRQVGRHRSRYDRSFARRFDIDTAARIAPELRGAFDIVSPNWAAITHRVDNRVDSAGMSDFGLILTEAELAELTAFIEDLAAEQLDRAGYRKVNNKAQRVRRVRRDLRGVPPDAQLELVHSTGPDSLVERKYVNTRPVRRYVRRTYMEALRKCVVDGRRRKLTLSQAHEYITTAPSIHSDMSTILIKHLLRKKRLLDSELDLLLRYFKAHESLPDQEAIPAEEFNGPDGETYFLLPYEALP